MAADRLGLTPNQKVELENRLIQVIQWRDGQEPKDRLTPRMAAVDTLRVIEKFLADEAQKDREFTHCPECGAPNGTNADCAACAEYRSSAASEHQAAEQETVA